MILNKSSNLKPTNVRTVVYPGFPTDLGQPMSVLLTQANGKSIIEETIYENRFKNITDTGLSETFEGEIILSSQVLNNINPNICIH
mgnify:CR=1 FL=1